MKVLITGFSPFGGDAINPTLEVCKHLPDTIEGSEVVTAEIPTVFGQSIVALKELIDKHKPELVICLGLAGGIDKIRVERVAINLDEARIPDNNNQQPSDKAIVAYGENAYFTNLPTKALVKSLHDIGIPATLSYSAGTFVCNHLFYGLMHYINQENKHIKGGFIHIPYLPEQVVSRPSGASMSLDMMVDAITTIILTATRTKTEINYTSGTLY